MNRRPFLLLLLLPVLFACSATPDHELRRQTYSRAMQDVQHGRFAAAIEALESLRQTAPDPDERYRIESSLAYALYKKQDYAAALQLADDIVRRYPPGPAIAYIHYLRGLIALKMGEAQHQQLLTGEGAETDHPQALRLAYRHFRQLIRSFPRSQYTDQAYKHLTYIRGLLAEYEVHQVQRLMMQKRYQEALDRARYVVDNYEDTPGARQAQSWMAKAHEALGNKARAERIRQQLEDTPRP